MDSCILPSHNSISYLIEFAILQIKWIDWILQSSVYLSSWWNKTFDIPRFACGYHLHLILACFEESTLPILRQLTWVCLSRMSWLYLLKREQVLGSQAVMKGVRTLVVCLLVKWKNLLILVYLAFAIISPVWEYDTHDRSFSIFESINLMCNGCQENSSLSLHCAIWIYHSKVGERA